MRYYSDYKFKDYSKLPEDINLIKQRLMEKGAMYYTYISFRENYYTTEDGIWTYSDNGTSVEGNESSGGHAVTLIGWDDNFSKDNFHPEAGVKTTVHGYLKTVGVKSGVTMVTSGYHTKASHTTLVSLKCRTKTALILFISTRHQANSICVAVMI